MAVEDNDIGVDDEQPEVVYASGVLTMAFPPHGTWVLNSTARRGPDQARQAQRIGVCLHRSNLLVVSVLSCVSPDLASLLQMETGQQIGHVFCKSVPPDFSSIWESREA